MPIQGVIRIVKTDSETGNGLPGAEFTVTRISGLPSHNGEGDGDVVAVITTDENGIAQTPLLTWGEYEIVESVVPDDYLDDGYSTTVWFPRRLSRSRHLSKSKLQKAAGQTTAFSLPI